MTLLMATELLSHSSGRGMPLGVRENVFRTTEDEHTRGNRTGCHRLHFTVCVSGSVCCSLEVHTQGIPKNLLMKSMEACTPAGTL